jgi:integrase
MDEEMDDMRTRRLGALSVAKVNSLKERGFYADGGNLYLSVAPGGTKSWVFRYKENGKARDMGLGPTHTITLAEAREKALEQRKLRLEGIDPLEHRTRQKQAVRLADMKVTTFGQCVEQYLQTHDAAWKNQKHRDQWRTTLTTYCKPLLDLPVGDIDTDLVLRVLTPLWKSKTETAARLRGRIERVLSWAKGRGLRDGENPARWNGHLDEMLAAPGKIAKKKHLAALPYAELPVFMAELREHHSLAARSLEFTILTAVRTGETFGATWDEIDLEAKIWTIPAERMKAQKIHRVPLCDRAIGILKSLPRHGERVFPLADIAAMLKLLRGMRPGQTTHGMRSSFRDWAAETTNFPNHVVEMALAHAIGDKVEKAYRRGDLYMKRAKLMQSWADYCAKPAKSGEVVSITRAIS